MEFTTKNLRPIGHGNGKFSEDNFETAQYISSIEPLRFSDMDHALVMPYENSVHVFRYLLGVPEKTDRRDLFINLMGDWYDSYDSDFDEPIQRFVQFITRDIIRKHYFDPSEVWGILTVKGWNEDDFKFFGNYKLVHSEVNDDGELVYRDSNGEEEIISEQ